MNTAGNCPFLPAAYSQTGVEAEAGRVSATRGSDSGCNRASQSCIPQVYAAFPLVLLSSLTRLGSVRKCDTLWLRAMQLIVTGVDHWA